MAGGQALGRREAVWPCWAARPMGCSWSLWIAQGINESVALQVAPALTETPLRDRGSPMVVKLGPSCASEGVHHYVYVDNLGAMGACEKSVGEVLEQLEIGFNWARLLLHKTEQTCQSVAALGDELIGTSLPTRVTNERF